MNYDISFDESQVETDRPTPQPVLGEQLARSMDEDEVMSDWDAQKEKWQQLAGHNTMWAVAGDNFIGCQSAVKSLPIGSYTTHVNNSGQPFVTKVNTLGDDLMVLPDDASEEVIAAVQKFWDSEDFFREYGYLWKRGILLWGPPGSGKTSTIARLVKEINKRNGIALFVTVPAYGVKCLHLIRQINPKVPIVVILEDLDAIIHTHGEEELLALLDGELQVDNVVFLATTNYPENLDCRIKNRPSRFDVLVNIDYPSADARGVYLKAKSKRAIKTEEELDKWVKATELFSIAHLKELIISVECYDQPFDQALGRIKSMMESESSSVNYANGAKRKKEFGFHK